jgi:hypothetical protein
MEILQELFILLTGKEIMLKWLILSSLESILNFIYQIIFNFLSEIEKYESALEK